MSDGNERELVPSLWFVSNPTDGLRTRGVYVEAAVVDSTLSSVGEREECARPNGVSERV